MISSDLRRWLDAWARAPRVGLVVTGDPALVDAVWPTLRELAGGVSVTPGMELPEIDRTTGAAPTAVVAHGDVLSTEQAVAITSPRVLVRAADLDEVPGALLDRCHLILPLTGNGGGDPVALLRSLLDGAGVPGGTTACGSPRADVPVGRIVELLTAAGLAAHCLDVPAARFAAALARAGAGEDEILAAVHALIIAPRVPDAPPPAQQPPPPDDPAEEPEPTGETEPDREPEEKPEPPRPRDGEEPPQDADEEQAPPPPPRPGRGRARGPRWPGGGGALEPSRTRGRPRRSVAMRNPGESLAILPTLAAATPWQRVRRRTNPDDPRGVLLERDDLRTQVRLSRGGELVVIVVDASGSMGVGAIRTAKAVALGVLEQGYRRRNRVALVIARGREAYVGLPPTKSVSRARDCVRSLPTGGGTPLASALLLAARIAGRQDPGRVRALILTDGAANVGLNATGKEAARTDAVRAIRLLASVVGGVDVVPLNAGRGRRRHRRPGSGDIGWLRAAAGT
ncbi:VWA domain-containing protein [Corynebacterium pygosceleis]|uniref:VWA domain-containing protein n=1 Tax=Corynebacterium pygosceleis TaxID=2800406 RepID=A0A9Q4C9N8_9CORY|nr:VWA domain-containing protein [Corynebacterium pygosceleis]MCK7637641.1 VWA domain-containing protein [Corynebacterium pygosceleis]MCK7674832.1 VWA domain-containing protein [Corynebacterium pygosceleis]MCL0119579.1 VWA domain-containing protein [Corynebacterium pygosceleis]MCX7468030.1 VWA domain-containing protein [Corynebacterium pygosceleis]